MILTINCLWIFVQKYVELNDIEPAWWQWIDAFFSFVYIFEVAAKHAIWSWEEYWTYSDNRFDFATSIFL